MLGNGSDDAPPGSQLSPEQLRRIEENRRAAEERLKAKKGSQTQSQLQASQAVPATPSHAMPGSSSQKTPASATAKTPKSGLVQKAITSFFKTPAPPSAGNAPSSPARSAEKKQAKLTDGAWGGRPSSAAPSSAAKSTPAATPSGVRPVVSAPLSSAVDRSDDLAVTVLDDDEEFATPSRARPVSDDDEEIVVSAKRKLKRPAIGESSDEEAVSAKKSPPQKRNKYAARLESYSDDSEHEDTDMADAPEDEDSMPSKTSRAGSSSKAKLDGFRASAKSTPAPAKPKPTSTPRSLSTPSASTSKGKGKDAEGGETRYPWLATLRDAQQRLESDPDYDPRTLYIPPAAFNKLTDFEKQFWEIKAKHFDTVVFFKKGKFYELYEKDAYIGHRELDLKLTERVNMAMAGVPENGVDDWAAKLLAKGYRVAKVDQMETKVGKRLEDKKNGGKKDKIIKRGLSYILTNGTLTDPSLINGDMSTYCLSVKEDTTGTDGELNPRIAVCFVDAAIGEFNFVSLRDDENRTQFETLILQLRPREIIHEKSNLSAKTMRILKTHLPNADFQGLVPEREYWSAETTLAELRGRNYFSHETRAEQDDDDFDGAAAYAAEYDDSHWPEIIQEASKDGLLFSAFGGLIWYLRSLKLERQLLSQRNFARYDPLRRTGTLMLDSQTLLNLDVLQNSFDGSEAGTLFGTLCRCETAFGKRLLKKWICHPLRNPDDINDRLDAVDDVIGVDGLLDALEARFRRLPDIERTISRIHAGTCKPKDFLGVLESLDEMFGFFEELRSRGTSFSSRRLRHLVEKAFPASLKEKLDETSGSFDVSTGEGAGDLLPKREFDEQFADCLERVEEIQKEMSEYLAEQRRATKCPQLAYKDINNEKFQLELPTRVKAPAGWIFKSKTQQVHRYHTPMLTRMIEKLEDAEELLQQARQTAKLRLYQKFDESYPEYLDVVKGIAELDCYLSLARARLSFNAPVCRPEFVLDEGPTFDVKALRHPQFASTTAGQDFIPNDTKLGAGDANIMLLTGANMAGKSTLLRQIGLCVILAQLGSYIPAQSCRLSPCDRIFTRIGANDNIIAGLSTFMVELKETSRILNEATPASLVILDELGRGTSTHDGYAIALAVLHDLVSRIGCLGLFTTHHAMLTSEFATSPLVKRSFMSYVSNDDERTVSFLYKVADGVSPKSYGMNVAAMAGVPAAIVDVADATAKQFESDQRARQGRATQERSSLPLTALADFSALFKRNNKRPLLDVALMWANVRGVLSQAS